MRKLLVVVLAATLLPAMLQAQSSSCTGVSSCEAVTTLQVVVPAIVSLDLGASTQTLTQPTVAALGSYVEDVGPTVTVRANRGWKVSVQANAANWAYTGGFAGVKPATDLTWSTTAGGTYAAMTTTIADVMTGARTSDATVPMFFRVLYPADSCDARNAAGTYALGLTFTIAAQ
jgi:hypothetical protein